MCGHHRRLDRTDSRIEVSSAPPAARPTWLTDRDGASLDLRASDAERDRVGSALGQAMALGYLDSEEFDQRTIRALRATTRRELQTLVADLPPAVVTGADPAPRRSGDRAPALAHRLARGHLAGYLAMVVIVLVIWTATAIADGPYYFWPIWPILGGGLGLIGHLRSTHRRPAEVAAVS